MQVCVWQSTVVQDSDILEFNNWLLEEFGVRGQFLECVQHEDGEQNDTLFMIEDGDVAKFATQRLRFGIRWWEDVLGGIETAGLVNPYPKSVLRKYPKTW